MAESNGNGHKGRRSPNYSARVIAQALALIVAGESIQAVSDQLKIPHQTVSEWKAQFPAGFGEIRPKREVIEDLLGQYLEKSLRTVLAQLDVISDPEWIKTQNAADLATLHGVVFDKSVRVFDAARRAAERSAGQLPPGDGN